MTENCPIPAIVAGPRYRKKILYDLDDFSIASTPPTISDGGPLLGPYLGGGPKVKTSMYERINKEFSKPVEKEPVTKDIDRANSSGDLTASLSVGLSGISIQPVQDIITEEKNTILIADSSDSGKSRPRLSISAAPPLDNPKTRVRKTSQFDSKGIDQSLILEAFEGLKKLQKEKEPTEESPFTAPVILPSFQPAPQRSERQRKVSAPPQLNPMSTMDTNRSVLGNFFFGSSPLSSLVSSNASLHESPIQEDSSHNIEPVGVPAVEKPKNPKRKRRVAQREMNLWLPQSM